MSNIPSSFSIFRTPTWPNSSSSSTPQIQIQPLTPVDVRLHLIKNRYFKSLGSISHGSICENLKIEDVQRLIQEGGPFSPSFVRRAQMLAAENGDLRLFSRAFTIEKFDRAFYLDCVLKSLQCSAPYISSFIIDRIRFDVTHRSTILEAAAAYGHSLICRKMCDLGVFKEAAIRSLEVASLFGFVNIVGNFLKLWELKPEDTGPCMVQVARNGRGDILVEYLKHPYDIRYFKEALNEAARLGNLEIIDLMLSYPLELIDRIEAIETALHHRQFDAVHTLVASNSYHPGWMQVSQTNLDLQSIAGMILAVNFSLVSQETVGYVLAASASWDLPDFTLQLIDYTTVDQRIQALELALQRGHTDHAQILESSLRLPTFLICQDDMTWQIDRETIANDPFGLLKKWAKLRNIPSRIIFRDEDGYGEGVTRQFYVELMHSLIDKIHDDEGSIKSHMMQTLPVLELAALINYLQQAGIYVGELKRCEFKNILSLMLTNDSVSDLFDKWAFQKRIDSIVPKGYLYQLIERPDDMRLFEKVQIAYKDPQLLKIKFLPVQKRVEFLETLLLKKHCLEVLLDFLELKHFDRDSMIVRQIHNIARFCCHDTLSSKLDVVAFAVEKRDEYQEIFESKVEKLKDFKTLISPFFVERFKVMGWSIVEGEPFEHLTEFPFSYIGTDESIEIKIDFIKMTIKSKLALKQYDWIRKFLFFVTGSYAYDPNIRIAVTVLSQESLPQAQTCFKILKISSGFDETPKHLSTWQERFMYKLEQSIEVSGYQLEQLQ